MLTISTTRQLMSLYAATVSASGSNYKILIALVEIAVEGVSEPTVGTLRHLVRLKTALLSMNSEAVGLVHSYLEHRTCNIVEAVELTH